MSRDHWVSAAEWGVIAGMIALDAAFAGATGIAVQGALPQVKLLAIIVALWPATALLTRITGFAKDGTFLAEIPGKFFTYITVASVLEYYLATSPAPLHDELMIRADHALGFDWRALCWWGDAHPGLRHLLAIPLFQPGGRERDRLGGRRALSSAPRAALHHGAHPLLALHDPAALGLSRWWPVHQPLPMRACRNPASASPMAGPSIICRCARMRSPRSRSTISAASSPSRPITRPAPCCLPIFCAASRCSFRSPSFSIS